MLYLLSYSKDANDKNNDIKGNFSCNSDVSFFSEAKIIENSFVEFIKNNDSVNCL